MKEILYVRKRIFYHIWFSNFKKRTHSTAMSIAETLARAKNKGWLGIPSETSDEESRLGQVEVHCDSITCCTNTGINTALYQPVISQPIADSPVSPSQDSDDPDVDEIDILFSDLLRYSPETLKDESTAPVSVSDCLDSRHIEPNQKPGTTDVCEETRCNLFSVSKDKTKQSVRQSKLSNADENQKKWRQWQSTMDTNVSCERESSAGPISQENPSSGFVFGTKISFGVSTKPEGSNTLRPACKNSSAEIVARGVSVQEVPAQEG
jgi:hypothetical protein